MVIECNCESLTNVTIDDFLTSISNYIFDGTTSFFLDFFHYITITIEKKRESSYYESYVGKVGKG